MKKTSLKNRLIRIFIITSILPIIILEIFSFVNISRTLRENMTVMSKSNLGQLDNNLNILLESYEDLLYQIYTDDDMVRWVSNLEEGVDEAVTVNQMRRMLSALLYSKEYIRAISVITPKGDMITYEQMTPATYRSSWLENFSMDPEGLYREVCKDYEMHILPTEFGTNFANKDYYLFHIAHRIIDYKDLERECGIAIISIDEELLQSVCNSSLQEGKVFDFIVDGAGRIISFGEDTESIGKVITSMDSESDERLSDYEEYYKEHKGVSGISFSTYMFHDERLGWDIVNINDVSSLVASRQRQLIIIFLMGLMIIAVVIFMSTRMSANLIMSVDRIIKGMKKTQGGDLSVRIEKDEDMPLEIESIADGFNDTIEKLNEAITRQQEAQIVALEAQINPHFLYNTLDTINWMAIDKDEYDISNAISSLATILRYAIVNSNAEVCIREEEEWMKKYIYLQQYRMKNSFACSIFVAPDVQDAMIHKMLLQPFVENAIVHGLNKERDDGELKLSIEKADDMVEIRISDNGPGMDDELIRQINKGIYEDTHKSGIGMKNAATRLEMYYGKVGKLRVERLEPTGTGVIINIPYKVMSD
ncbi:MAG: sensor histidine kinase [Lachnospiraceae bacterium]|nr:sensor histidine kinase [Lachnospiraceae bacterium]